MGRDEESESRARRDFPALVEREEERVRVYF